MGAGGSTKYIEVRRAAVREGAAERPAGPTVLRAERGSPEDPGGQGRGWLKAPRLHRRDQHALPAGDRAVLLAQLRRDPTQEDGRVQPHRLRALRGLGGRSCSLLARNATSAVLAVRTLAGSLASVKLFS